MIIEKTKNEIIFRLPSDMNIIELQDLADWVQYMEATRKTKAKQADVDTLVADVKKGRWMKRKPQLLK